MESCMSLIQLFLDKSLHSANSANLKEVSEEIWHQRYGHLNKRA